MTAYVRISYTEDASAQAMCDRCKWAGQKYPRSIRTIEAARDEAHDHNERICP